MDLQSVFGLILASIVLISLIVLLYLILIPLSKIERNERKQRQKMYKAITQYFELENAWYIKHASDKEDLL